MSQIKSTITTYNYDGDTRELLVPFDYIRRDFVKIYLAGPTKPQKLLTIGVDYKFTTKTTIIILRQYQESEGFNKVIVRRVTDASNRIVNFQDGSILNATELNVSSLQALHVSEEARDLANYTLFINNDGDLDAKGRRIINVGDPLKPSDVVNKKYIDEAADSIIAYKNETLEARDTTLSYKTETEQALTKTKQYRDETLQIKNEVNSKIGVVEGLITEVSGKIENADSLNKQAIANGDKAVQAAESAKRSALEASESASNAVKAANKAETVLKTVTTFKSIAELRKAIPVADNQLVNVLNYFEGVKGGGGTFYYDSSDKVSLDDSALIIVSNNTYRWKRVYTSGEVNISWYGNVPEKAFEDTKIVKVNIDKDVEFTEPLLISRDTYSSRPLIIKGMGHKVNSTSTLTFGSLVKIADVTFGCTINVTSTVDLGTANAPMFDNVEFSTAGKPCIQVRPTTSKVQGVFGCSFNNIRVRGKTDCFIDVSTEGGGWISSFTFNNVIVYNPKYLFKQRGLKVSAFSFENCTVQIGSNVENLFDLEGIEQMSWGDSNKIWDGQLLPEQSNIIKYVGKKMIRGYFCYPKGFRSDLKEVDGTVIPIKLLFEDVKEIEIYGIVKGAFSFRDRYTSGMRKLKIAEGKFSTDYVNLNFIMTGETGVATGSQHFKQLPNVISIRLHKTSSSDSWVYYGDKYAIDTSKYFSYTVSGGTFSVYFNFNFSGPFIGFKDLLYDGERDIQLTTSAEFGALLRNPVLIKDTISDTRLTVINNSIAIHEKLNTPYTVHKLQKEGLYEDFLTYMEELEFYEKTIDSGSEASLLISIDKPKPSEGLQRFMETL